MKFHHFCPPCENPWLHLENYIIAPLIHNVWLIMDNWWTTVLWSGSTKLCNSKHFRWFALKNFFGLHIKSLIDLNIFGATFGIGGGQLSHCPPPWLRTCQRPQNIGLNSQSMDSSHSRTIRLASSFLCDVNYATMDELSREFLIHCYVF